MPYILKNEIELKYRKSSYFTLFKKENYIECFYRRGHVTPYYKTYRMEIRNNKIVSDEILDLGLSEASHNFRPFYYKGKLFAIGGLDYWGSNGSITYGPAPFKEKEKRFKEF